MTLKVTAVSFCSFSPPFVPFCALRGWTDGWRTWLSDSQREVETGRGDQLEYKEKIAFTAGQYKSQRCARSHGEDAPWDLGWKRYSRDGHSNHSQVKAKARQQVYSYLSRYFNIHSTSDPSSSQSSEPSRDFGEGEGAMSLKRISRCSCEPEYTLCTGERMGDENCGKGAGEVGDLGRCPGVGPSDTVERVHVKISLMISLVGISGELFSSNSVDRSK